MSDDVKALIAEIEGLTDSLDEHVTRDQMYSALIALRSQVAALEAAQPQGEYHEGLEEGIKIGRAEAVQQETAIDIEALAKLLYNTAPEAGKQGFEWEDWSAYEEETQRTFVRDSYRKQARSVISSGIIEDATLIRSEGYDEGWNDAIHDFMVEGG